MGRISSSFRCLKETKVKNQKGYMAQSSNLLKEDGTKKRAISPFLCLKRQNICPNTGCQYCQDITVQPVSHSLCT